jgi:hypothetical protein
VNADTGLQKQTDEPFIFSLIRRHLPHDDQEGGEQATISNRLVYALMALVTLGILVWVLFVFSSAQ